MTLTRVRAKGQITLPEDVRRAVHLEEGDYVEIAVEGDEIVMRPRSMVPKSQAWFWTEAWQAGEREASADIAEDRTRNFESDEAFLESLR